MGDISDEDKKNRGHHSGVRDARRAPVAGRPSNTETPAAHLAREREGRRVRAKVSLHLLDCHYTIYGGLNREVNTRLDSAFRSLQLYSEAGAFGPKNWRSDSADSSGFSSGKKCPASAA